MSRLTSKDMDVINRAMLEYCGVTGQEMEETVEAFNREFAEEPDVVNHPDHYNQINGVECIDVIEQMPFNTGNAMKYLWRYLDKGEPITDLEKAIWYINREISRLRGE